MKCIFRFSLLVLIIQLYACSSPEPKAPLPLPLTPEQLIKKNIDSLKSMAKEGDLIVRQGDDLISEQIKYINDVDKTYSHSGMILEYGGKKMVCHIAPDVQPADTIQFIPIDSFLNPRKNQKCALYRYTLTPGEIDSVKSKILELKSKNIRFDKHYDLATLGTLYCSEMLANCLNWATKGRMQFKLAKTPKRMYKMMMLYFKDINLTRKILETRDIITIDNLYRRSDARLIMEFPLKYFPGQ